MGARARARARTATTRVRDARFHGRSRRADRARRDRRTGRSRPEDHLLFAVVGFGSAGATTARAGAAGEAPAGAGRAAAAAATARAAARAAVARCPEPPTTPRRRNRLGSRKACGALGCPDSPGRSGTQRDALPALTAPCRARALRASSFGARGRGVPLPRRARRTARRTNRGRARQFERRTAERSTAAPVVVSFGIDRDDVDTVENWKRASRAEDAS